MKHRNMTTLSPSKQKGITLVELMIASAMGLFLTLGVTTLYIDSKQTDKTGSAMASIQESTRIAMDTLAREIRMAGFQGCADSKSVNLEVIAKNPPTTDYSKSALQGWEVTNTSWVPTGYAGTSVATDAIIGSDVIKVQRGIAGTTTTDPESVSNANIKVSDNNFGFVQGDAVMVSNCESADLFRITSNPDSETWAHASSNNTKNRLSTIYSAGGTVYRFSSTFFYVADTGRDDAQGEPIYALYRQSDSMSSGGGMNAAEELVEGVESIQLLYGHRLSNDNIRYVPASSLGDDDWQDVVNVRIGLLVSSKEKARSQPDTQSYSLPGVTIVPESEGGDNTHPGDFRLRKTFTLSVTIRNRA